jgi:rod shape-determining protein MreC
MDSFFYRFRNPLVLITVVLLQVIALAMQVQRPSKDAELPASARAMESAGAAPDGKHVSLLRRWTVTAMTPVETAVHGTSLKLRGAWGNYINLRQTRQQDAQLKQEVARLREEEASFAEDAQQGRRLQKLLGFKESYVNWDERVRAVACAVSG